jgi:hypothetical protein
VSKRKSKEVVLRVRLALLEFQSYLSNGPVALESVVDSALLRSIFRPFKPAFLYTTCTQTFLTPMEHLVLAMATRSDVRFLQLTHLVIFQHRP